MLKEIVTYVRDQVFFDNLILNRCTKKLTSSVSSNKTVLAVVEQEDYHDVIRVYVRTLDCRKENSISVCYEEGLSLETNNMLNDIETTSVSVSSNGNFVAFRDGNEVKLHLAKLLDQSFLHRFPIMNDPTHDRSVEFINRYDDQDLLVIHDAVDSVMLISNYEYGSTSNPRIIRHKLNRVKALFYRLLQNILFRIC